MHLSRQSLIIIGCLVAIIGGGGCGILPGAGGSEIAGRKMPLGSDFTLRTYAAGDYITYDINGSTDCGTGNLTPQQGKLYVAFVDEGITNPQSGQALLTKRDTFDYLTKVSTYYVHSTNIVDEYFSQDLGGNWITHGRLDHADGTTVWYNQGIPFTSIPSPLTVGDAIGNTYTVDTVSGGLWSNLGSETQSCNVADRAWVYVFPYNYETLHISCSNTTLSGPLTQDIYVKPSIGIASYTDVATDTTTGCTTTATYTATDTNIVP